MPDELRLDLTDWMLASKVVHTGTDGFGNHLSPQEKALWQRILRRIEERVALHYAGGDELEGYGFMAEHLNRRGVKEELLKRLEEKKSKKRSWLRHVTIFPRRQQ